MAYQRGNTSPTQPVDKAAASPIPKIGGGFIRAGQLDRWVTEPRDSAAAPAQASSSLLSRIQLRQPEHFAKSPSRFAVLEEPPRLVGRGCIYRLRPQRYWVWAR